LILIRTESAVKWNKTYFVI